MTDFQQELCRVINRYSKETDSNTPDFLLAQFLNGCLESYNSTVAARDRLSNGHSQQRLFVSDL